MATLPAFGHFLREHQKLWGSGDKQSSAGFPPVRVINLVPAIAPHFLMLSEYYVHAGAEADQTGRRSLAQDLPEDSVLCTDAGYTDYIAEDVFEEATGCRQQTARKKNSRRPHEPHETFLLQHLRKTIETSFSQLTARFSKQIHAATAAGFVLKLVLFIFAHSLDQAGL